MSERDDDGAGVTRRELEQGLRFVNVSIANVRDDLLRLAAQVVALTEVLAARVGAPIADDVAVATPAVVEQILDGDERALDRVLFGELVDKYELEPADVPCAELLHLCHAACCKLKFALTTQDLDEGVVRWDYGRPYLIKQRESDHACVHNDAATHFCTVHAHRPGTCRTYSCADDKRIWLDFEQRLPAAAVDTLPLSGTPPGEPFDLHTRARTRQVALTFESASLRGDRD